jgi:hypothetical protein
MTWEGNHICGKKIADTLIAGNAIDAGPEEPLAPPSRKSIIEKYGWQALYSVTDEFSIPWMEFKPGYPEPAELTRRRGKSAAQ